MGVVKTRNDNLEKPDIFGYHDYRQFLTDWLAYHKANQSHFNLSWLSKKAGISVSQISMVLSGSRKLSSKIQHKLMPHLGLKAREVQFLELLILLGTTDSQELRVDTVRRMRRFKSYKEKNPKESEAHQYLTKWYYVAIRELVLHPEFRPDPLWIQDRLHPRVELGEIRKAWEFLTSSGYVEVNEDGATHVPKKDIECVDGIFRLALAEFHNEMFSLASRSIQSVPRESRHIMGHTFSIEQGDMTEAREIINDTILKLKNLGQKRKSGKRVYHLALGLFPLTKEV